VSAWTIRFDVGLGLVWVAIGVDRLMQGETVWGLISLAIGIIWLRAANDKRRRHPA
jgi:hypothetical protein